MKSKHLAALVCFFYAFTVWAGESFIVKDIRVEGIQRTEAGTVFSYLPVKVGDILDDVKATAAIKALYATGFFKDVRLKAENGVLIVQIDERPAIAQIDINGAKEFEKDQLKDGLKQAGLTESRIFDRSVLERAELELKRQYISRGKYAVKITTTTTPLERNRVGINFDIDEGKTAKIRQINFVGNKAFDDNELRKLLVLKTPGILSWFTKDDQYSKQKLSADLETLRSHYLDRGYLEFNIESTQVSITPDMQDIYITINVTEGNQYTVSDIKLAGETLLPEEELRKLIQLEPGEVFVREKLTESVKLITDRLGDEGYAFANVNASPELDKEAHQTAFTFFIDPGRRVYVRRINISGNDRTRDEVIRREFRQMEGAWHSTSKINLSRQRVDRLFFFNSVNVETPPVPDAPDQVDVNMSVVEKPTGAIMFGAGFSDREGLILNGSISQNNIFGTGNFLSLQVNTGSINKTYAASFTNPYYTVDGVSLGFDVFRRNLNTRSLSRVGTFRTATTGATIRVGIPIAENDTVSFGFGAELTSIGIFDDSPQRNKDFVAEFGRSTSNLPLTVSWARDRRDSAIWTTSGTTHRLFGEVSAPIGDLNYYKLSYAQKWFYPVSKNFTLMLNGEAGIGDGYSGKPLPFFKNFFAGGNNSIRGYDLNSLGPRDERGIALGGNKRFVGNIEVLFPVPFMQDDKSVRLSTFVDGGTVFAGKADLSAMRYSAGVAVTWISPMGPLKVSLAKPLNDKPEDNLQVFQFQFGQTF
ncbi:Beta-barrel assembly machine subunit BamA [Nitrosomonas cryotolerans]|uniref:Outer membrane protein assembly factor BamA n=1 Tax=Nitrosomonas cryotolerans ATCC 49181 TaxID=1131553 RepID=A0A1N6FC14_9PROT|nr:outer membrane protein assembly factor BamA [Nitrosomonas cryotolerans]SFP75333.1 Beta-barrel assembly machine subunit BamA [Nitrosomonas cryotolerans]SIN92726.1 Beta-barrel assembly machine subunit BamA [Nitrosomonas cryotolerans ATCC 49181]